MTPSEECKAAGLKSLAHLAEITGRTSATLINWHRDDHDFFKIVLRGATNQNTIKVLQANWLKEVAKKVEVMEL